MQTFCDKYLQNENLWEFEALSVFIDKNPFVEAYKYINKEFNDVEDGGDGFATGVVTGLMEGLTLSEAVKRGTAIGAIQVMSRGDNEGLPTRQELKDFMNK